MDSPIIQLSLDGVHESKSSTNCIDVFSLKFNNCRNIYPIGLIRPCEKFKYDEQSQIERVLSDINDNDVTIDCVVLDKPKRSTALCCKGASAKYPCEYCEGCAVHIAISAKSSKDIEKRYEIATRTLSQQLSKLEDTQDNPSENEVVLNLRQTINNLNAEKDNDLRKVRKQLTWPSSTMTAKLRTLDSIREIVDAIENDPELLKTNPDFCKGIKGKSLFLDQPFFNLLKDMPCEYMHLVCLGTVKRLIELTIKVGENRERITKRKLSLPKNYNEKIKKIQVHREYGRRCRNMDLGVMKAAEMRNVLIFFFPIVLECIEDEYPEEKRVWLHLVFLVRACVISNDEFRKVDTNDVKFASSKFYKLYEECYGRKNCTNSIHVVGSHILQMRGNSPLTFKSAFKFENFFAEMRNMFHAGTVSPLKQILQNCFVKRLLEHHVCEKSSFYSVEKQPKPGKKFNIPKENNHLIYTLDENYDVHIFIIDEIIDHEQFRCKIQGKFQMKINLRPEYNWSDVGVYKIGPISEELQVIQRKHIKGKVLKVNEFLITCPNNVLHEQ